MSRNVIAEAVAHYEHLLQGDVLRRTHEQLLQAVSSRTSLRRQGRSLYRALRPRFITLEQHREIQRATLAVNRALEVVFQRACRDEPFRRELALPEWVDLLAAVDAHSPLPSVIGRMDGLMDASGVLRFIEYNTAPGGLFRTHDLAEVFHATPIMESFSQRYAVSAPCYAPHYIEALRENHARTGRTGPLRMAFFGPAGPDDSEEEEVLQAYFQAQGILLELVTSEDEWSHRDGQLFLRDLRIDAVTFISAIGFGGLVIGCGPEHPVMEALRAGSAWFMNGLFRTCVLRSKALFAILSTQAETDLFDAESRAAVARHVPWTRLVREGTTRYRGEDVDLVPFILEHREQLVLKPTTDYGGTSVTLGWETDAEHWRTTLQQAREETWVVQERVTTPRERFPYFEDGQLHFESLYSDLNPFVWNDARQESCLVRLSTAAVVNVAQGGSLTPLVVIRER
ncbi:hypothetical protein JGU66_25660 [Myxococcaceae bacterium JPH2]|nr:hypothetical protein [Myxococcaceae bacterium JPH2]